MLTYDKGFVESNFCNIGLIDKKEFPKAIELIQKSFVNTRNFPDTIVQKTKPTICTSAHKTACRITSQLKKDLRVITNGNHSDGILEREKLAERSFNTREDEQDYEHNDIQSYDKPNKANRHSPGPEHKKSPIIPKSIMDAGYEPHSLYPYNYYPGPDNSRMSPDIHVKKLKEILGQDQPTRLRREYMPEGKDNKDPFLQRIQEYRVLYQAFMENFASNTRKKGNKSYEDLNDVSSESLVNPGKRKYVRLNQSKASSPRPQQRNNVLNRSIDQKSSHRDMSTRNIRPTRPESPEYDEVDIKKPPVLLKQKPRRPDLPPKAAAYKGKQIEVEDKVLPRVVNKRSDRSGSPKVLRSHGLKDESLLVTPDTSTRTEKAKIRSRSELKPRKVKRSMDVRIKEDDLMEDYSQNISHLLAKCSTVSNTPDFEIVMDNLIHELRKNHAVLSKLSQKAVNEIMRTCSIINIKNQELYRERENNEFCYIILSGEVYLKSKMFGVFKRCMVGESIGEEAIIDNNFLKQETAQIISQTALLEINLGFMEKLRDALAVGYRSDYTILLGILRKNLYQKKAIRQKITNSR